MCTISSSSLGDLLSSLLCSKQGPQGHADEVSVLKDIPSFRILQTAACLPGRLESWALLQAWVAITVACGELVVLSAFFSSPWPLCLALEWSRPVSVSLTLVSPTASAAGDGMANQAVLEILLGLADLPQAGIISLPGNRRRHQGTATDCEILGLGFLELLKERK